MKKLEKQSAETAADVDKLGKESSETATQVNKVGKEADETAKKKLNAWGDIFKGGLFANIATSAINGPVKRLTASWNKGVEVANDVNKLAGETGSPRRASKELNYVFTLLDGSTGPLCKIASQVNPVNV